MHIKDWLKDAVSEAGARVGVCYGSSDKRWGRRAPRERSAMAPGGEMQGACGGSLCEGASPRRGVARVLLTMLLGYALAGCSSGPVDTPKDGRTVVHYWEKWTGFEGEAMQAVVEDFNASQDRIWVEKLTVSQLDQKLMLATAGGNPPDVSGLWSHTVNDFAEKGALTPLDTMLERANIGPERYIPVFWELCSHRGMTWALPSTPASTALHWNKKLFREAGLDPDRPPRSLDELDRMAEALTVVEVERQGETVRVRFPELTSEEKRRKDFEIVQMGHLPHYPGWWLAMWPYWFGGHLWDGERRITADSPEAVKALRWIQSYAKKYGVGNLRSFGSSFGNFSSPQNPFLSGQIAMVLQGVWMYNFIDKYAPHLEWGVAPFPAQEPDPYPMVTVVESDVLVIPKGARHPREAFAFIRYVNTQGPMEKLCLGQRKFSPLATMSADFLERHPNPYIETFVRLARSPHARYVPRLAVWNEYRDEMQVAVDRVLALSEAPAEALADVQRRMQWKFDRVLRRWDMVKNERLKEWRNYDPW